MQTGSAWKGRREEDDLGGQNECRARLNRLQNAHEVYIATRLTMGAATPKCSTLSLNKSAAAPRATSAEAATRRCVGRESSMSAAAGGGVVLLFQAVTRGEARRAHRKRRVGCGIPSRAPKLTSSDAFTGDGAGEYRRMAKAGPRAPCAHPCALIGVLPFSPVAEAHP